MALVKGERERERASEEREGGREGGTEGQRDGGTEGRRVGQRKSSKISKGLPRAIPSAQEHAQTGICRQPCRHTVVQVCRLADKVQTFLYELALGVGLDLLLGTVEPLFKMGTLKWDPSLIQGVGTSMESFSQQFSLF